MPPVRADHGLAWRKGGPHTRVGSSGADGEERAKQPRRSTASTKRHSPSHSRTPSPNQQGPCPSGIIAMPTTTHGHVFAHGGTRRSPSSKAGSSGSGSRAVFADSVVSGPREKRRASPEPTRKGYPHAQLSQRSFGSKSPATFKTTSSRNVEGMTWVSSSPTPGMGSGRVTSSPTLTGNSNSSSRGHSSPTLGRGESDVIDGQAQVPSASGPSSSMLQLQATISSGLGSMKAVPSSTFLATEAREMTQLDRVFLEQSHESRKDVEGDDLDLCDEIQRHLQSRVQSQQSQLMEAASRSSAASAGNYAGGLGGAGVIGGLRESGLSTARARATFTATHCSQSVPDPLTSEEMELINDDGSCYSPRPVHENTGMMRDPASFVAAQSASRRSSAAVVAAAAAVAAVATSPVSVPVNGSDFLDDPDLGSAGVPPVSPSSGGGPAQGLILDVGGSMDFFLDGVEARGGGREGRSNSGPRSRSPLGTAMGPEVQISGDGGGDGQLREVVSGLDAMDLDDVDRALALLTAQKKRIIAAKQHAGAAAAAVQAEAQAHVVVVPPQPPPHSTNGGASSGRSGSGSSRHRRSSGRSRHSGEGSPSAGGRSEAFGGSGGGIRGAPMLSRVPRVHGRPPPVPGHLSASTAAMRRSSPGSIASLAELDSYLEHHHRRLVEQVTCAPKQLLVRSTHKVLEAEPSIKRFIMAFHLHCFFRNMFHQYCHAYLHAVSVYCTVLSMVVIRFNASMGWDGMVR